MTATTDQQKTIKPFNTIIMLIFAFMVGIIGGFGAVAFRKMIGFVHNLMFLGHISFTYDANVHSPAGPWGIFIILVPVIGAVVVTWLVNTFAPEAKGHGVPEVMNAVYHQEGKIRPIVAIIKSVASAISIGTGGSVGREGPIIQIGAAFGSALGQFIKMPTRQRNILIACGAGAGIAATFNAPIGGLAFAMELLMVSITASSVVLVAIATVTATYICHIFFGLHPSFYVPGLANRPLILGSPYDLALFVPFGFIAGLSAALFVRSIYWAEDFFDAAINNSYIRHMIGMLILGIMIYLFLRFSGHYYVNGVGYSTIIDILKQVLSDPWFLLLLFAAKLLATCLTLGSGASGGIFSPSLYMGATLGSFIAYFLNMIPGMHVDPVLFAIAGMAAMVGGTTGAVITAITMTYEQTRDYQAILPIMVTVGMAYVTRVWLTTDSIYTLKLHRRGLLVPQGLAAGLDTSCAACHVMTKEFDVININDVEEKLHNITYENASRKILVEDNNEIIGYVDSDNAYLSAANSRNTLKNRIVFADLHCNWPSILRRMRGRNANMAIIMKAQNSKAVEDVLGVITPVEIMNYAETNAELMTVN